MQYLFAAIYTTNSEGTVDVFFPDLPGCYAQGQNMADAAKKAEAVLCLCLFEMEQYNKTIPTRSSVEDMPLEEDQKAVMIMADTDMYNVFFSNKPEPLEVDMPLWMSQVVEKAELNLSFLLENALRCYIGLPVQDKEFVYSTQKSKQAASIADEKINKPKYAAAELLQDSINVHIPVEDLLEEHIEEESTHNPTEGAKKHQGKVNRASVYAVLAASIIFVLVSVYFIAFTDFPNVLRQAVVARLHSVEGGTHQTPTEAAVANNIIIPPEENISEILQERFGNEKIFAQIGVVGTGINEAVLLDINSDFYHSHNINNAPFEHGAVFMKTGNLDMSGNIVIYGGSPSNGGQFAQLRRFLDPDFFAENNLITLITDDGPLLWQIFSFYIDHYDFDYDTGTPNNVDFAERSIHDTDIIVTEQDVIITLITEFEPGSRYILHGKLK